MMVKFRIIFLVLAFLPLNSNAQFASPCEVVPALNSQILKALKPFMGKKLDRGECWDAAAFALNKAGAKWDGLYDFGRLIDTKKECIQPGDIVQFENVNVEAKPIGKASYSESFSHHTAIVYSVSAAGVIELLHQNTGQFGKRMGVTPLKLSEITSGKISFFRPIKAH